MTSKFANKGFGVNQTQECDESDKPQGFMNKFNNVFTPSTGQRKYIDMDDNPFFKEIQVKDITPLITSDCEFWWDFDTAVFMACSVQDETKIKVANKTTGEVILYKNRTEFKGGLRKEGAISDTSKLGVINIKRIAEGLEPYTLDDFEIQDIRSLKEGKSLEDVKDKLKDLISSVKTQFRINDNHKLVYSLGSGDCFRSNLDLPEPYKGNRDTDSRPTLLNEARDWLVNEMGAIVTVAKGTNKCLESDDVCSIAGYKGYVNYLKTGKFSKVQIGYDKDDWQGCCMYINYHLKGVKFKIPQALLIHNTTKGGVGTTELYEGDCKSSGLLQVCYQMCCGDSSDHYHPYLRFPKSIQPSGDYADVSFFKDFVGIKTPKEALQKVVDIYYNWFPKGLSYTNFKGEKIISDTMSWANTMFMCVYMKRSMSDNMDFYKLCSAMGVDCSKVINNHIEKQLPFVDEHYLQELVSNMKSLISDGKKTLSDKKGKKSDLEGRLDKGVNILKQIESEIDNMFDEDKEK